MSTDLKLFQHLYEEVLGNRRATLLTEARPEILKLCHSRKLFHKLFEEEESGGGKLVGQWCQQLTKLLLPVTVEEGNNKGREDYGTNVWVGSQLVLLTSKQSNRAFVSGVQGWVRELLKCLSRVYLGMEVLESVTVALSELIQLTKSHPTLEREVTSHILPQFNTQLLSLLEEHAMYSPVFFDALYGSLRTFPKTFRPLTSRFQQLLLDSWLSPSTQKAFLLQSKSQPLAQKVLKCLPQLATAERSSAAIAEVYNTTFASLVATGHNLLNFLLASLEEEPHPNVANSYPFKTTDPSLDKSSFYGLRYQGCLSQFILTCHAIVCFLNFRPAAFNETPLAIPLQELMSLICRVYSCNNSTSMSHKDGSIKNLLGLLSVLPTMYSATHDIFIKLSRCLGPGALEHCKLLSEIIRKLLYFSENHSTERHSAYCLIYHVIDGLGETVLYHSIDTILTKVMEDLHLQESKVAEQVLSSNSGSSKKKRRDNVVQDSIQSSCHSTFLPRSNYAIALNVLDRCLQLSRFPLPADLRLKLDTLLFRHASLNISGELDLTRSQLLALTRCLLTVTLRPSPAQGILVESGITLFASLQAHPAVEVRQLARQALAQLDTLIHPQLPHVLIDKVMYSEAVAKSYRALTVNQIEGDPTPVAPVPSGPATTISPPQLPPTEPTMTTTFESVTSELKRPHIEPLPSPKRLQTESPVISLPAVVPSLVPVAPPPPSAVPATLDPTPSALPPITPAPPATNGHHPHHTDSDSDSDDEIPTIVA